MPEYVSSMAKSIENDYEGWNVEKAQVCRCKEDAE